MDDGSADANLTAVLPVLVLVPVLVFWACCLVGFSRTEEHEMRTFTREQWLVILTLGSALGGALWLAAGRPRR